MFKLTLASIGECNYGHSIPYAVVTPTKRHMRMLSNDLVCINVSTKNKKHPLQGVGSKSVGKPGFYGLTEAYYNEKCAVDAMHLPSASL
jgi:hypothetical protein